VADTQPKRKDLSHFYVEVHKWRTIVVGAVAMDVSRGQPRRYKRCWNLKRSCTAVCRVTREKQGNEDKFFFPSFCWGEKGDIIRSSNPPLTPTFFHCYVKHVTAFNSSLFRLKETNKQMECYGF